MVRLRAVELLGQALEEWSEDDPLLRQRAGEPLGPLVAEQRAVFAPLFERLADHFDEGEADRVIAAWRYESSQAVARLLDHVEALDRS